MAVTGVYRLKELYNNFDYLKDHHKNEIGNSIFKYEPEEIDILTSRNLEEELNIFKNTGSKYWSRDLLFAHGFSDILKSNNINSINEAIEKFEISNRMQKSRLKKLFDKAHMNMSFMKKNRLTILKTNRILYNELKTKFYKEAS